MKKTIYLTLISGGNVLVLFGYQMVAVLEYGLSKETDAFFASLTLPLLVINILINPLVKVLLPFLIGETEDTIRLRIWGIVALVSTLLLVLTLVLTAYANLWISLIFPGFDQNTMELLIEITPIQLFAMIFTSVNIVLTVSYHARREYIYPEIISFFVNSLSLLAFFILISMYGVIAGAWFILGRSILQFILISPKNGFPSFLCLKQKNVFLNALKQMKPLLAGSVFFKTELMVDRYLLSLGNSGSLSTFTLGQQVYAAGNQVISKAFTTPMIPRIGQLFKSKENHEILPLYKSNIRLLTIIALAIGVLIFSFDKGWSDMLGLNKWENYTQLSNVIYWLFIYFFATCLGQYVSSCFYVCEDTKTPTYVSVITYSIFVPIKVITFINFGIKGLALSTSIYHLCNLVIMMHIFIKKNKQYSVERT